MAEHPKTKTFHCDAPDCKSSCEIVLIPTTDAEHALTVRGWVCAKEDGDHKHYCQMHKEFAK